METIRYTTKVKTADGKVYDLGKWEYPPQSKDPNKTDPKTLVVNAWTEPTDA